ncbi:MAG: HAD hydrolase-like protein [Candidatus Eisenbacteria bacterium]
MHRLVWLFDIDGTLLLTQGAGRDALVLALRDSFGVEDDLEGIRFSGRTDPLIVGDILARHGLAFEGDGQALFWDRVVAHMHLLMHPPRGGLLPGVPEMLTGVEAEPGWVPALLTGNVTRMAAIKLGAFGVRERFVFGTYGEEGVDRDALARLAVQRAAARHGVGPEHCVVVGDTEHDVQCARAAGAHAVAVATGSRTLAQLEACSPDLALADLTEPARLLDWARRL